MNRIPFFIVILFMAGLVSCQQVSSNQTESVQAVAPKNIIVMVSDGMSYNHLLAANYYQHGKAAAQVFEQEDWSQFASATYHAIVEIEDGDTTWAAGYNPRLAWSDPRYIMKDYTGSAEAATALSTGRKTYATAIGLGPTGDTLVHVSQAAKALGKSAGVITSVPFSHATPAGFSAHVDSRHDYSGIASYMFFNTQLDLIMGAGHPDYDNNGQPQERNDHYVPSAALWDQIMANDGKTSFEEDGKTFVVKDVDGDGQPDPWTFVEDRDDFVALASGETPKRVLGIAKAYSTLHYGRDMAENETMPFTVPMNEQVPTLEEMTHASLNILDDNPNGFFLMIEGGAVDWAGHDNYLGRMIEEQVDFNHSVKAVVEWVETHSSWEETLVIITSDHETGYLTGPDHPQPINQPVINQGAGNLPQAKWNSESHTNQLVPVFAKGPGINILELMADERDPVRGPFIQNSEIGSTIFLLWGKPEIKVHQLKSNGVD
ncbi:MAG: alkaline phosphatase [Bacteroidales bacterium]